LLRQHYPASTLLRPCPTPADAAACCDVEAATLARDGSPPDYPNHLSDVPCPLPRRIKRVHVSIASPLVQPSPNGRRVGIRIVTFEACIGFTLLRPAGSLSRPRRPLSRGSSPASYPAEPLVSFRINRQLSGWNLPPLMIRAFGAHCQRPTWRDHFDGTFIDCDTASKLCGTTRITPPFGLSMSAIRKNAIDEITGTTSRTSKSVLCSR